MNAIVYGTKIAEFSLAGPDGNICSEVIHMTPGKALVDKQKLPRLINGKDGWCMLAADARLDTRFMLYPQLDCLHCSRVAN